MSFDTHSQVRAYAEFLQSTLPVVDVADVARIRDDRAEVVPDRIDELMEHENELVTFVDPWPPVEADAVAEPSRSMRAVVAVAAAVVLLVGFYVVTEGDSNLVVTDPVSSVSSTELPASSPTVTDAPVADPEVPPGCPMQSAWVQVCDAALNPGAMYAVTSGGPGLVAVGSEDLTYYTRAGRCCEGPSADAVVWTSPDGLTWTRLTPDPAVFGGAGSQQMFSVTAGGPGLVAVGRDGPSVDGGGHGAVWTSPDGLTWSRVPHDEAVFGGPGEQRMLSVTVGGPGLVAVGFDAPVGGAEGDAAVWTSPDGLTWSRVPDETDSFGGESRQMMLGVTNGPFGLVAVGSDGHSDDASDRRIDDSAADAAAWSSPDGIAWSRVPHDETVFGGPGEQQMASVTVGGPGLVAVGRTSGEPRCWPGANASKECDLSNETSDAAVWTSPDGLTWSRVPHDEAVFGGPGESGFENERMLSVTAGGPGLVAVGFDSNDHCGWDSAVWTSPDGLTWSRVPDRRGCAENDGYYDRMLSVTVGPNGLVAVGEQHDDPIYAAVWNG